VPLFLARVYENELVGGIPTPLKNMNLSVPIYGKIKMFQTTNQIYLVATQWGCNRDIMRIEGQVSGVKWGV